MYRSTNYVAYWASLRRRQTAEVKLADRERRLGTACQTIDAQHRQIRGLIAEVTRLRGTAASSVTDDYGRDAARFFSVYTGAAR